MLDEQHKKLSIDISLLLAFDPVLQGNSNISVSSLFRYEEIEAADPR